MKRFVAICLAVLLCLNLVACTAAGSKGYESRTSLGKVDGRDNLYYDMGTKIVYFIFNEFSGYQGYGYMSPYYAPNGLPYLYDENSQTLIEIDER